MIFNFLALMFNYVRFYLHFELPMLCMFLSTLLFVFLKITCMHNVFLILVVWNWNLILKNLVSLSVSPANNHCAGGYNFVHHCPLAQLRGNYGHSFLQECPPNPSTGDERQPGNPTFSLHQRCKAWLRLKKDRTGQAYAHKGTHEINIYILIYIKYLFT